MCIETKRTEKEKEDDASVCIKSHGGNTLEREESLKGSARETCVNIDHKVHTIVVKDTLPLVVHMVGSISLPDAESVFIKLGTQLGEYTERIPDGETGRRVRWVSFIWDQLQKHPDFEVDSAILPFQFLQWDGKLVFTIERLKFKEGYDPDKVQFDTGYAEDAIRNYKLFEVLKSDGIIPSHVKYQICIATPLAIAYSFISPAYYDEFISIYSRHLADEIKRISDNIPHDQISLQWDVCQEVLMLEGYFEQHSGYKKQISSTLANVAKLVPATIDLGFHLCYGSPKGEHLIEPKDMNILVELANSISNVVTRPINYIHMPVPKERNDDSYFRPLSKLSLNNNTALYLGLVHQSDKEGNTLKLLMARKYADIDGIASECGLGRGNPKMLDNILEEHLRLASDKNMLSKDAPGID